MKKFTLFFIIAFMALSFTGFARKITIKVSNYQFSSNAVNALVGDTIIFKWVNGKHTTTSLTIPVGAKAWDRPIDVDHQKFKYILKVAGVYNYQCNPHSSAMKGKITVSPRLAANFNSFSIAETSTSAVLNWKTSSSDDVAYFSIQRSTDGSHFSEINRVTPQTSGEYSFKDNGTLRDKYVYYQVVMVDVNGNKQLSSIQMYTNKQAGATKLITSLSPNPLSTPGHLMIQFNADKDGFMTAKLYNQTGLLVKEARLSAEKGLNNGHFHMGDMAPGTYYIVFMFGDVTEKHTIIMK